MKYFQDEDNDSMKDYDGSLVFRHWNEDEEDDNSEDYDGSLVFRHWNED